MLHSQFLDALDTRETSLAAAAAGSRTMISHPPIHSLVSIPTEPSRVLHTKVAENYSVDRGALHKILHITRSTSPYSSK
jgi:hypothetical protein